MKNISTTALLASAGAWKAFGNEEKAEQRTLLAEKKIVSNDKVRIAVIGMGIMGHSDLRTALKVPGAELAAVCDLYDGRLLRAKEMYGNNLFTTRDYREILDRKDPERRVAAHQQELLRL